MHVDDISVNEPIATVSSHLAKARSETPGSEKIQLLRQQMEQNRQKMAERKQSTRGIEEMVTQLKVKFDNNQISMEKSAHLGRSIGDLSVLSPHGSKDKYQSASDLTSGSNSLDKERIRFLEKKNRELEAICKNRDPDSDHLEQIKNLENKIFDLEENLREKECVIQARTQAVSLLSENMSMKGKNTVDLLEDTKQEMYKMQQKFIEAEDNYKKQIEQLQIEIEGKNSKITNMEEINDILETTRYDLTLKNSELELKISEVQEFSNKISELNKINQSLQHRIQELESNKPEDGDDEKFQLLENEFETLQNENDDLKKSLHTQEIPDTDVDLRDRIRSLEASMEAQKEIIAAHLVTIETLENNLQEKTIEYNVLNANFSVLQEKLKSSAPKSLFSMSTDEEAQAEITKLKAQLDEANKSMIKTKLKTKQLQKQVDSLKKASDTSKELIALTEQNQLLQQKITELEELKSPDLPDSDLGKRIQALEATCQNQVTAIRLLEEQKLDMNEDLSSTKSELITLRDHVKTVDDHEDTARVTSHMDIIEKEEKIEEYLQNIAELKMVLEKLTDEKNELNLRLNNYVADNMELMDKLEKASKGSSAESIEIVENLTQQEKLEMEAFHKSFEQKDEPANSTENNTMSPDLSESLIKLREECSELMQKIEMFTIERREVLDKMEVLKAENDNLIGNIASLNNDKTVLEGTIAAAESEKLDFEKLLKDVQDERNELQRNVQELSENRILLQEELNNLRKSMNDLVPAIAVSPITEIVNKENYVKGIKALDFQLECYRKGKDKNAKFELGKKLTKEAKNVQELMATLLSDYEACVEDYNNLHAQLDGAKQNRIDTSTLDNLKYETLEKELSNCHEKMAQLQTSADKHLAESERLVICIIIKN